MKIKGLARQNPVKACKIRNPRATKEEAVPAVGNLEVDNKRLPPKCSG